MEFYKFQFKSIQIQMNLSFEYNILKKIKENQTILCYYNYYHQTTFMKYF